MNRYQILAAIAALTLAGCAGGESTASGIDSSTASSIDSPSKLADKLGCQDSYSATTTDEIFVEAVGECDLDGGAVRLLTFANDKARDSFVDIARGYGSRYVTGETFAVEVSGAAGEREIKGLLR